MRTMRTFKLIVLLITLSSVVHAQDFKFRYRSSISGIDKEGWYAVPLSPFVLQNLRTDFTDIRILNINGKDTTEAPYILKMRDEAIKDEAVDLPMINKSTKDGKQYVTFEVKKNQHVNSLDLDTDEHNFNGYVQIEGSADQKEWFSIDSLQRILSIEKDGISFKATTLNFPVTNYSFLRLKIDVDHPLRIITAAFKTREVKAGEYLNAPLKFATTSSRKTKQTVVDVSLNQLRLISYLIIGAENATDYYRPIVIEELADSIKTPKGWSLRFNSLYTGYIVSGTSLRFDFDHTLVKKFRVTIYNEDNPPLKINSVAAYGPKVELVARMTPGSNYLFYGNQYAESPNYDIVHFEDKIPQNVPDVNVGKAENLEHPEIKSTPLLESKFWIWVVMGLIIAVLGYFTLTMMKAKT